MPSLPLPSLPIYVLAALCEIAGCYAFWAWLRLGRSVLWLAPGLLALSAFAWLLTLIDQPAAGRSFAAYGGIYIAASLTWMWLVEGIRLDRFDLAGMTLALVGALVIVLPAR